MDIGSINRGRLRHPVYGNRSVWRDTNVQAGFVDRGADKASGQVRKDVLDAIDTATAQFRARH